MRIAVGEAVEVVNGQGTIATALVSSIDKHSTTLQILNTRTVLRPERQIILAIPLMRPNKLEFIVEKGTELGVGCFWLYSADFSEKAELSVNQLERLRNLTVSALKQSGRLFLPGFEILSSLEKINGFLLFGDTRPEAPSILDIELHPTTIFVTGPERGFSLEEVELLEKKAKGIKLNANILRAETAPLAAASILGLLHG
jgi:16S rRNA (uracil1498-N3)-methyltransferase